MANTRSEIERNRRASMAQTIAPPLQPALLPPPAAPASSSCTPCRSCKPTDASSHQQQRSCPLPPRGRDLVSLPRSVLAEHVRERSQLHFDRMMAARGVATGSPHHWKTSAREAPASQWRGRHEAMQRQLQQASEHERMQRSLMRAEEQIQRRERRAQEERADTQRMLLHANGKVAGAENLAARFVHRQEDEGEEARIKLLDSHRESQRAAESAAEIEAQVAEMVAYEEQRLLDEDDDIDCCVRTCDGCVGARRVAYCFGPMVALALRAVEPCSSGWLINSCARCCCTEARKMRELKHYSTDHAWVYYYLPLCCWSC